MSKYNAKDIINSSIWMDPCHTRIADNKSHNITYDPVRTKAYLLSKPKSFEVMRPKSPNFILTNRRIDLKYIKELANELEESLLNTKYKSVYFSDSKDQISDIEKIQHILGNIYRISWILF